MYVIKEAKIEKIKAILIKNIIREIVEIVRIMIIINRANMIEDIIEEMIIREIIENHIKVEVEVEAEVEVKESNLKLIDIEIMNPIMIIKEETIKDIDHTFIF